MSKCIEIAKKGMQNTSPNPMVGCVIVNNDNIIGEGYHKKFGEEHAEVNAINNVKDKNKLLNSCLYVNLEPCSHHGKTPPCVDLILKYNIPRIVIGSIDPFNKVNGSGIQKLKENNRDVVLGILESECYNLNKRFFTYHQKKRPYIILKWAKSIDGFIAPLKHDAPFWMTNKNSKKIAHNWRAEEDAIMIGRKTAEKDNPLLTTREVSGKNPVRIIIDKDLKLSKTLNIYNDEAKTIVFNKIKHETIQNINYIKINFDSSITNILYELYKKNILSVIIEGGSKTIQNFIDLNLWDEARIFETKKKIINGIQSPKITGNTIEIYNIKDDTLDIVKPS